MDGNLATATLTVTLDCATVLIMSNACNGDPCASPAVCDGDCVDLDTFREHCGKCGRDCEFLACSFGQCDQGNPLVPSGPSGARSSLHRADPAAPRP